MTSQRPTYTSPKLLPWFLKRGPPEPMGMSGRDNETPESKKGWHLRGVECLSPLRIPGCWTPLSLDHWATDVNKGLGTSARIPRSGEAPAIPGKPGAEDQKDSFRPQPHSLHPGEISYMSHMAIRQAPALGCVDGGPPLGIAPDTMQDFRPGAGSGHQAASIRRPLSTTAQWLPSLLLLSKPSRARQFILDGGQPGVGAPRPFWLASFNSTRLLLP